MTAFPVTLTLLAAAALAIAPLLALPQGSVELLALARIAAVLIAAWGLHRRQTWGRWLVTLLAVLAVWAAGRAWWVPLGFRILVPYYRVWRAGRTVAALLLVGAASAAWSAQADARAERLR
ncbi:MAG TPA: hypothetical protein VF830_10520 [Gemmatimonadales bacterium]|jgi:hypothetical protein